MSELRESVKTIFGKALEICSVDERARYLNLACAGEETLRAEVDDLLGAIERAGNFLGEAPPAEATLDGHLVALPGMQIGPYKLMEQIGEGGMGLVFVAEQHEPVRRKVALKLIKPGMNTREVIARFEAERQALALMDHPNIARVLDAGSVGMKDEGRRMKDEKDSDSSFIPPPSSFCEAGRPYFVMELVRGLPITEHCDQHQLTTQQRLNLFIDVCQAVQHAHQKGIIHRDLKPTNVLVSSHDGTPVVKVIDFGVAKAIGPQLTEKTVYTAFAQMIGTPLYMSPEQAGMSSLDVDTRSDIYSLGVLLYELLTGTTPFDKERLRKAEFDEVRRIIREEEPPKPSTRLSTLAAANLSTVSAQRQSDSRRLSQSLRGELDWIVMKALEKDRNRRYETAKDFAADVQRYLGDEPVQACPPSALYRFRKFARRNKAAIGVVGMVLFFLIVLGGGAGWALRDREAREQGIALETARKLALTEEGIRQALDRGTTSRAELHTILKKSGGVQQLLNQPARWELFIKTAQGELAQARRLVVRAEGSLDTESTWAMEQLEQQVTTDQADFELALLLEKIRLDTATSVEGRFDYRKAADEYPKAFAGLVVPGDDPVAVAARLGSSPIKDQLVAGLDDWALVAVKLRQEALAEQLLAAARQAAPDPAWGDCLRQLKVWRDQEALGKLVAEAPAAGLSPQVLVLVGHLLRDNNPLQESWLRQAQAEHPADFWLNFLLAIALTETNPAEAAGFNRVALAVRPGNSTTYNNLGAALVEQKKLPEAIAAYHKAIALDPKFSIAHYGLGTTLAGQGKLDEAITSLKKAIELDPNYAVAHYNLGKALHGRNRLDEAIAAYHKAIEIDARYVWAYNNLGLALHDQKKLDEAMAAIHKAIELDPKNALAYANLGSVLRDQKKPDEAIAAFHMAIELDPKIALAHNNLGWALQAHGKLDEAIACYCKAVEIDPKNAVAYNNLGAALNEQQKLPEAIAAYHKAIEIDPQDARVHNNLGVALFKQHKLDEAIAAYQKAIEIGPKYALTYVNLGNALDKQEKLPEALAAYQMAIKLDPTEARGWAGRGWLHNRLGQLDNALADQAKAIELEPKEPLNWNNRSVTYLRLGQLDKSLADSSKAIDLDAKFAPPWFNRGEAHRKLGQFDKAADAYRTAITLKTLPTPDIPWAHRNLAIVLNKLGNKEEARKQSAYLVELAKKTVQLAPNDPVAWQDLGWDQYRAGAWEASIEALEKSCNLERGTGDCAQWIVLALAHGKLAKEKELPEQERARHTTAARRWYDQAVKQIDSLGAGGDGVTQAIREFRLEAAELLGVKENQK